MTLGRDWGSSLEVWFLDDCAVDVFYAVVLAEFDHTAEERTDELYMDFLFTKVAASFDVILPVQLKHHQSTTSIRKFNLTLFLELRTSHYLTLSLLISKQLIDLSIAYLLSKVFIEIDMLRFLINPVSYHEVSILEWSGNEQVIDVLTLIEVGVWVFDGEEEIFWVRVESYLGEAFFKDHLV